MTGARHSRSTGRRRSFCAEVPDETGAGMNKRIKRLIASSLYLLLARHMPWSPRPGGRIARSARGRLARYMLDYCGADVNVEHGAWFGSGLGVRLGDRSAIGMDALVMGPVIIGNDVMMGPRCILISSTHEFTDMDSPMTAQGFRPDKPIVIEDDVWIGAGVTILPGRRLKRGCIVGAGSVVTKDVVEYEIVGGNPAVAVGSRSGSRGS
jgi:maltose O-acetyltransferase